MRSCVLACKNRTVCRCWNTLPPLYVLVNIKFWSCWNSIFRKIFGFAKHESVRAFIYGLSRLDFLHLRMMLSYKFMKHALCNSNDVLLSVARLRRLSKDFKTLESHIAASCEVEFCSVGLSQKTIRRRFEESLL